MRLPPEEDALALRELHDVITHAVTELAFEAGAEATRRHGDARAVEAARALTSVMRDLRRMAPLIQCGGDAPYGPQPDLCALEELVRAESPVPLEARLDVCDAEVPASTALACYRIVGHL